MSKMFSKEFLSEIQQRTSGMDVLGYIMASQLCSFHDAVIQIAEFLQVEPVYVIRKKDVEKKEKVKKLVEAYERGCQKLLEELREEISKIEEKNE